MIFFFNVFSYCQLYSITKQTMQTIKLKPDDNLFINVSKSDYFIHVQDYFFYGTLNISIYNTTTNKYYLIQGKPRDRLRFTQCILNITYISSSSICKITVWSINSRTCNCESMHYSGLSEAFLKIFNHSHTFKSCYFFELTAKPKIRSSMPTYLDSRLYFMSDNGTYTEKFIDNNITDFTISELSVLSENHYLYADISYDFYLSTDLKYVDFTTKDSHFNICVDNHCNSTHLEIPLFTVKRNIVWWIWLIIYIVPTVFLAISISLMLINPRKEISFFSSSKPIVSENSKASLLSLY